MAIMPTNEVIVEKIQGAVTEAIATVGELDEPREAAEWIMSSHLERFEYQPDQDLTDEEDQIDDLRYYVQSVLEDIHDEVKGMENGSDFHVELIYTYEIEDYYNDNQDACDEYFDECQGMASNMDELKSYMVHMALSEQAYRDVYDLAEAIEDIDVEDIV